MRIALSIEQLDLLEDIIQYYVMSDFGGGDHSAPAEQAAIHNIQARVATARAKVAEVNEGEADLLRRIEEARAHPERVLSRPQRKNVTDK